MSESSFHQHFRAITTLSPLQFQKQFRLIEARRLMLAQGATISYAAHAVGYEACRNSPATTPACSAPHPAAICGRSG
ncbi:helix-turn-helix domain-containing protein [Paenirhodobacter populi]|uniref:helix-turn-helix domain-containing protein n=1 Tax=Paenirhodobacter populi TaxID=2306993 RepID=UPI001F4E2B28|nr:AraC family transcriptional regulator [Sinirhodobacter populi]